MSSVPARVKAFDWLRGLAVVFMVETHALALLRPELRVGELAARLNFINGLVAPSFIFASGFSLALVQVRAAASGRAARVRKTLRRIAEVIGVGVLVNFIWFHFDALMLLRLDILPCIGLSLLLTLPVIVTLARRPWALTAVMLGLALLAFGLAPFGDGVRAGWGVLVNRTTPLERDVTSVFPLLPWIGYVFLGATVGAVAGSQPLPRLKLFLAGVTGLGALLWQLTPFFMKYYPPHAYAVSDPGNHGLRTMFVGLLLLGLLSLEDWAPAAFRTSLPVRWVDTLGTTSLAGYFFHEELLFFNFFGFGLAKSYRDQATWPQYLVILAGVLLAVMLLVNLVNRLYPKWDAWASGVTAPKALVTFATSVPPQA